MTSKPTRTAFDVTLPEPRPDAYGRNVEAYERDKAAWRRDNDIAIALEYYAELTDEKIAEMEPTQRAHAVHMRKEALEYATSIRKLREDLAARAADPVYRAERKAAWDHIWDELLGEAGRVAAAEREANKGYRNTYTATRPHSARLAQVRKNLKGVVAAIDRHEKRLADIEAAKVALAAPRMRALENMGNLAELASDSGWREQDELRQLRPKVAHWEAEVARLEPLAAAEKAAGKSTKRGRKI